VIDCVYVALFGQYGLVIGAHEHRAKGMVALRHRLQGNCIGRAQMTLHLLLRRIGATG
jgi:hypothetical protein